MKKTSIAILVLLALSLAGCAVTPISAFQSTYSDTKGTTPRVFQSSSPMDVAGKCAMHNIQERIASFNAAYSDEPTKPGTKEIRARSEVGVAAIVEFEAGVAREWAECLALLEVIRNHPARVLKSLI